MNGGTKGALHVVEMAFVRLGWNMTPVHMLRDRVRELEEQLARFDWDREATEVLRRGL